MARVAVVAPAGELGPGARRGAKEVRDRDLRIFLRDHQGMREQGRAGARGVVKYTQGQVDRDIARHVDEGAVF